MSWVDAAFAPRRDHKGMSTPSYAARWWLPVCTAACAVWSWQATDGHIVMAAALTLMIATLFLTIGWYLIGIVSARIQPRYIIPQAERAHKARLERKNRAAQQDSV